MKLKLPLLLLTGFAGAASAFGQLVAFNLSTLAGNEVVVNGSLDASVSSSSLSRGTGLTATTGAGSLNSSGFTTGSFDTNDYYELSITPAPGYTLNLDTLAFAERRSGTGIRGWSIRTNLDSFGSDLVSVSVPDDTLTRDQSFTFGPAFDSISSLLTIRIYGFSAEQASGTWRLTNHSINSDLRITGTAVPEPSAFAAVAGLGALGVAALRRRRRA